MSTSVTKPSSAPLQHNQGPAQTTSPQTTTVLTNLQQLLEKYKTQIAVALPKHMTVERMIRVALSTVSGNKLLMECDLFSIAACVVQASILGLEPNSLLGEAYLVPFYSRHAKNGKGGMMCQLMPGYLGLLKLCRNSGQLSMIDAQAVHEKDIFDCEKGLEPMLKHRPAKGDRGAVIGYWACYVLKDGARNFEYMTVSEIEIHRDRYSQGAFKKERGQIVLDKDGKKQLQGPWADSPDWMYKKTVLRQLMKLMPKAVEPQVAISLDEQLESGRQQQFTVDVPLELAPPVQEESETNGVGLQSMSESEGSALIEHAKQEPASPETDSAKPAESTGDPAKTEPTSGQPAQQQKLDGSGLAITSFDKEEFAMVKSGLKSLGKASNQAQIEDFLSRWGGDKKDLLEHIESELQKKIGVGGKKD